MKSEIKKPFGLQIAVKIAAKALKEGQSPSSTILYNLFSLQKDTIFPKDLDTSYFNKPNQGINLDKRIIVKILDDMKNPKVDINELLEKNLENEWVKKSNPTVKAEAPVRKLIVKNKKLVAKVEPTIVIKKNKLVI